MNKSQRIHIGTGDTISDKYIKIKLEKDVDTFEVLSLKIDTKDAYNSFNSDYGVLVGRVNANGGVGVPNAKISVFIPIEEEDRNNSEIYSLYPYTTPRDKNNQGKRYNLLPRVSRVDPQTNEIKPQQPFGSFPTKEEIVTNPTHLEVYKKYYKYSTVTNNSGDYMIFGVPTGTQTVHMSVDITDIGQYSMTPAAMVTNLGYSENLFTNNNTRIKPSEDLDDLPNVETQEVSVDVIPFWGDSENFEIGITRQDFRVRAELNNTFIVFGSVFTDGDDSMWGNNFEGDKKIREFYRIKSDGYVNSSMLEKRIGNVTENIYYYPNDISDEEIDNNTVDPSRILKLSQSEYTLYKRDGDFVVIISCNRRKVITNELGIETIVSNDSPSGIFTRFRGFMTIEYTEDDISHNATSDIGGTGAGRIVLRAMRCKIKIPQSAERAHSFRKEFNMGDDQEQAIEDTNNWRRQSYEFSGGGFYSVAKFHSVVRNQDSSNSDQNTDDDAFLSPDKFNDIKDEDFNWSTGIIITNDASDDIVGNDLFQFPSNSSSDNGNTQLFGGNWLNFSLYLPQFGYTLKEDSDVRFVHVNTNMTQMFKDDYYLEDNTQEIAAGDTNTKWFARSDLHYTNFVNVPKQDITNILENDLNTKGFINIELPYLTGIDYKNGSNTDCPENGGKLKGDPNNGVDPETYFYRGVGASDSLKFLRDLGII